MAVPTKELVLAAAKHINTLAMNGGAITATTIIPYIDPSIIGYSSSALSSALQFLHTNGYIGMLSNPIARALLFIKTKPTIDLTELTITINSIYATVQGEGRYQCPERFIHYSKKREARLTHKNQAVENKVAVVQETKSEGEGTLLLIRVDSFNTGYKVLQLAGVTLED